MGTAASRVRGVKPMFRWAILATLATRPSVPGCQTGALKAQTSGCQADWGADRTSTVPELQM